MKLRCKPDQLCRIIGGPVLANYNKLVQTKEICPASLFLGGAMWHVLALQPLDSFGEGPIASGELVHYLDKDLEPYADPEAEGKDETLTWKPVPVTEKPKEIA